MCAILMLVYAGNIISDIGWFLRVFLLKPKAYKIIFSFLFFYIQNEI